jgi:hypothetical protein
MPPSTANKGGANPEFILREIHGMNTLDAREAINDNEFWWCENAIPVAAAALYPVGAAIARGAVIGIETTSPTYTMTFTQSGINYQFVVFAASGNGYIIRLGAGFTSTLIITGLTSGQTYATPYNNQGILIIDPTGYWDWNITAPSTLTPQNNALTNATLIFSNQIAGGTQLKNMGVTPGGLGSGATVQTTWTVVKAVINAAGTGYQVGDSLTLTDGSPTTPAQIIVSTVGGGGTITGITLPAGGSYPGPLTSTLVATGPTGTVVSGGSGTGATFTVTISTLGITILTRGTGYTGAPFYQDLISTNVAQNRFNFTSSGVIGGIGIATYAGRVWIALNRTIYFTDINSYNSFGGAGGFFTINDSYLHANITVIFAANNYLYICGDTSIDALSNVTITLGVTSFSRINITASVGTSSPASVFAYYRGIVFFNVSGIYLLAGATPEKISEKISGIINNAVTGFSTIAQVYGAQVLVRGELCAAMQFVVSDTFSQLNVTTVRVLMVLYFRGRWWVYTFLPLDTGGLFTTAMASISNQGVMTMFGFRVGALGVTLYQLMPGPVSAPGLSAWLLKTKLYDAGAPMLEKQSLNAAIAGQWANLGTSGVTINVDSELATASCVQSPLAGNPANYGLVVSAGNMAGGQYIGLSVSGSTDVTQIDMLALRAKAEHDKLA